MHGARNVRFARTDRTLKSKDEGATTCLCGMLRLDGLDDAALRSCIRSCICLTTDTKEVDSRLLIESKKLQQSKQSK